MITSWMQLLKKREVLLSWQLLNTTGNTMITSLVVHVYKVLLRKS